MEKILSILTLIGVIETIILVAGIIFGIFTWIKGIAPALFRLGNGLSNRKIAIFAKNGNLESLKHLLYDSGLFKEKNIYGIHKKEDFGRAESVTLYLVYWPDYCDDIDEILDMKSDNCPLIVYTPYENGRVSDEKMKKMDGKRNTSITNFRGRLLNDIVIAMMTTSYLKK